VDVQFTADNPFDFCVAKTTNSRKYELARTLSKPVVTVSWLRDSAAAGALLPVGGIAPQLDLMVFEIPTPPSLPPACLSS